MNMDALFRNIGKKIKTLAKVTVILGVIATIILMDMFAYDTGEYVLIGGLGGFVTILLAWFLYAYGELLSRVSSIDDNLRALSMSTHEEMNRNIRDAEARARQDVEERARKEAAELAAKRKAQWNSVAQTVDIVGEEIAQTANTVVHFVADEGSSQNSSRRYNSNEARAKRQAEWDAELQKRKEAEDRARQVVEERMRRRAEERAQKESGEN